MKKLKPVSLSQLTTSELHFLAIRTMGALDPLRGQCEFTTRQYDKIEGGLEVIDQLTGVSRKNGVVPELNSEDEILDSSLIGYRATLNAKVATAHFNPKAGEDAASLLEVMDIFGRELTHGSYQDQGKQVAGFLAEMAKPENNERAVSTGVVRILESINETFGNVQRLLNEKMNGTDAPHTNLGYEKKKLRYRLEGVFSYVDRQISDDIEHFAAVREKLNNGITEVMAQFRTRKSLENSAS